jgi:hypothetical protein
MTQENYPQLDTYVSPENGFTIGFPQGWETETMKITEDTEIRSAKNINLKQKISVIINRDINISIDEFTKSRLNHLIAKASTRNTNIHVIEQGKTKIEGRDAVWVHYQSKGLSEENDVVYYNIHNEGVFYSIFFFVPSKDYKSALPTLNEVLSSFDFLDI